MSKDSVEYQMAEWLAAQVLKKNFVKFNDNQLRAWRSLGFPENADDLKAIFVALKQVQGYVTFVNRLGRFLSYKHKKGNEENNYWSSIQDYSSKNAYMLTMFSSMITGFPEDGVEKPASLNKKIDPKRPLVLTVDYSKAPAAVLTFREKCLGYCPDETLPPLDHFEVDLDIEKSPLDDEEGNDEKVEGDNDPVDEHLKTFGVEMIPTPMKPTQTAAV
jgi:hypothetical protein